MGHRTDEKRYANARLECCPDCGAIWACLSTGSNPDDEGSER